VSVGAMMAHMSRSRRKTPIVGITCAESDKSYKVSEHRADRRSHRALLTSRLDPDDRRLHSKVYGDSAGSNKDGKQYLTGSPREMRK
jgi:hypothetical protein